jgi:hypothetical protein
MSLEQPEGPEDEKVRLSPRQKRELLELVAAGVMSAVFFVAPVVLVRDTLGARPQARPRPVPEQVAAAGEIPAPSAVAPPRLAAPMAGLESVRVVRTDVAAPVSTPELLTNAAVVRAVRWSGPRSRRPAPAVPARMTIGRRIARLFAGDGTHTVQPFPVVPATDR